MSDYPKEASPNSKVSVFGNVKPEATICGLPILKIRDTTKAKETTPEFDIVDEALYHFRTNIFMRDFPARTGADKLIIYLTFYGMKCLKFMGKNKTDLKKCQLELDGYNLKPFPIPGDSSFIISSYVGSEVPSDAEKRQLTDYFKKLRTEMGNRLLRIVFADQQQADKWWICFSGRKFLNKDMTN